MAMIECPNCRMQISDKARQCVHCGTIFVPKEKMVCVECGAGLEEGVSICPMCGCPIGTRADAKDLRTFQQMKEIGTSMGGKSRKAVVIVAVIVLLIVAAVAAIGIAQYQKKKAAEETAQQLQEYSENLELVTSTMLSGADAAGSCCSLIDQVWYNAIYGKANSLTDKYTQPDGYFVSDFNEALDNLFADPDFYVQINALMENQKMVNSVIDKLENPPEKYSDTYESVSELYNVYIVLTNMAVSPEGSLNTFMIDYSNIDAEFIRCCQMMKIDVSGYQKNRAEEAAIRDNRKYLENLWYAVDTMLSGAADSENCCNLIVQVWNNAIWEREDSATDQYTRPDGHFVTDFNEALNNLFADSDFYMQINNIVENQDAVNSLISQLKNPPEEYKEAYKALSECYDAYRTFTNMTINPTGSLKSFSADFDAADTEFMHCYHVMEFYLQE